MQQGYVASIPITTTAATTRHTTQIFTGMTTIHTVGEPAFIWVITGGIQAMADFHGGGATHITAVIHTGTALIMDMASDTHTDTEDTGEDTIRAIGTVTGMDTTPEQDIITTVMTTTHTTTDTVIRI
jgi:hypothetical protein